MPLTLEFGVDEPLFCMRFHPEKPQFLLGFATGRVSCYAYDLSNSDSESDAKLLWSTKRHKGSCRALSYSQQGDYAVSCGSDGAVKRFDSQTGRVSKKTSIAEPPAALCVNEAYVVIGDEAGKINVLDLNLKPHRSYDLEGIESISSICALDSMNKHNFAVSGDMHVFRIDVRKDDVSSKSEDQEDDILCGCIASETRSAWGMSDGVLTVWNNRGLSDQQQRIRLSKDGSVDCVLAGEHDDEAIVGTSDGWVALVDLVSAKVLHRAKHNPEDEEDEVAMLDYDFEYRLASASMSYLRLWGPDELQTQAPPEPPKKEKKAKKAKKGKDKQGQKRKREQFADLLGDE